jgi:quercetin dioxygenase-like cupin family protein
MRAERVLRDAGAEGVGGQRCLAAQQLEIGGEGRQMQDALLGADAAAALRQKVQVDTGSKPYSAAVAATFAGLQHHAAPYDDPKVAVERNWDTLTRQHKEGNAMKVVTLSNIPNVPVEASGRIEGWTGPISRTRQTIIEPGDSANYNCSVVNFSQGCTTGWHTHDCDQVLVVTSGSGMVATEHDQHEINVGDVVHIKAGERHWHGAKADTTMGHITITAVGGQAKWG